jgi:hypothetical protein
MAYYRCVSPLTSFSKVFEKVIHVRVFKILNNADDENYHNLIVYEKF